MVNLLIAKIGMCSGVLLINFDKPPSALDKRIAGSTVTECKRRYNSCPIKITKNSKANYSVICGK